MHYQLIASILILHLFTLTNSTSHEGLPLLNPGGIGGIFKGPDSETIIRGPDGSEITSEQKGGSVIRDDIGLKSQPIIAAESEIVPVPIVSSAPIQSIDDISLSTVAPSILSAPIIHDQPTLLSGEVHVAPPVRVIIPPVPIETKKIDIVEQDPHIIETEIIPAPDIEPDQESDLKGPSGRIITKGSASIVSGPASTTITEPRKVVIAPIKISKEVPIISDIASVPIAAPVPVPAPILSIQSSTAIPSLAHSLPVTPAPALEYGYSTVANSISEIPYDSNKIDLGPGNLASAYSPVIDYGGSNGVLVSNSGTVAPQIIAESPSSYLIPPPLPLSPSSPLPLFNGYDTVYTASTPSPFIQKIPKSSNIVLDGRVDMGYRVARTPSYELPQVLSIALSELYGKSINNKNNEKNLVIDDKLGELSQNEINDKLIPSIPLKPDLAQTKYIGPALLRNGVDLSQVNLAPVPLSQVTKFQEY